jgi:hypothetical protein
VWTRAELKAKAWKMLQKSYWKAFLVSLAILFVTGGIGDVYSKWRGETPIPRQEWFYTIQIERVTLTALIVGLISAAAVATLIALAIRVFIANPVEVGGRHFFSRAAQGEVDMDNLGYAFDKERYMDIVIAMAWRGLVVMLWYLLFIIPGIIKSFAYSMVPYILGDNPHIGYNRALELSEKMTDGHKWDMFVLDLSFIGWQLLGALALGIGGIFVTPYINATKGELYLVLRQNSIDNGITTYEELGLSSPTPPAI